jgi:DNA modification methylase
VSWSILNADARQIPLMDKIVQCVVTSPPYWGLRDYGQDGQIGLEKTPQEYVDKIVAVFREVWRVLRDDGVIFVNLGDSYAAGKQGRDDNTGADLVRRAALYSSGTGNGRGPTMGIPRSAPPGLKAKDLCGIPWMVAFALRADGWYLRSDIIWSKPNPMPESVTDRPTKAHEYIFLLSKNERYFWDQDAIKEDATDCNPRPPKENRWEGQSGHRTKEGFLNGTQAYLSRNIRTVWTIATQPYPEAHFATFPEELAERCIKAGTSEKGCCAKCSKARERMAEQTPTGKVQKMADGWATHDGGHGSIHRDGREAGTGGQQVMATKTLGWQPACKCEADSVPCTVLDPFGGAGTTVLVADKLGRRGIGLELKNDYCKLAERRCYDDAPLLVGL